MTAPASVTDLPSERLQHLCALLSVLLRSRELEGSEEWRVIDLARDLLVETIPQVEAMESATSERHISTNKLAA